MNSNQALLTDLYQLTMLQGYFEQQMEDTAVFEFFVRKLPKNRAFLVAAGLEQVLDYLQDLGFTVEEMAHNRKHAIRRTNWNGWQRPVFFHPALLIVLPNCGSAATFMPCRKVLCFSRTNQYCALPPLFRKRNWSKAAS